jgi:replicative DNA helicase
MKIVSVDSSDEGVQDGNSIVWLVHFQNLETEINLENYAKLVSEKDAVLDAFKRCKHKAEEYIAETLKELKQIDVSQLKITFIKLRLKLHILKELHTVEEFSSIELKYTNYFKDLKDLKDERKISILLRAIQECKKNIERLQISIFNLMIWVLAHHSKLVLLSFTYSK